MLSHNRMHAHSAEIEAMPGCREFQRMEELSEAQEQARYERSLENIYEEALRGDRDLSYLVDRLTWGTHEGGLYHQFCDLLERFRLGLDNCPEGPETFDQHLDQQGFDFEQLGRDVWRLYKNMAEVYAEDAAEDE